MANWRPVWQVTIFFRWRVALNLLHLAYQDRTSAGQWLTNTLDHHLLSTNILSCPLLAGPKTGLICLSTTDHHLPCEGWASALDHVPNPGQFYGSCDGIDIEKNLEENIARKIHHSALPGTQSSFQHYLQCNHSLRGRFPGKWLIMQVGQLLHISHPSTWWKLIQLHSLSISLPG